MIDKYKDIIGYDTARIEKVNDKLFFIIGYNKNTKSDKYKCFKNGKQWDYDYCDEKVIASGTTNADLEHDLQEYIRISRLSQTDWIKEILPYVPDSYISKIIDGE